jgi:hypothetical protein
MATDGRVALAARVLGAVTLWLVGAIHLKEYNELYASIPTIGTLFMLSFVGATAVALGLLTPLEWAFGRLGRLLVTLLALAGIAQATTQFVFLAISEHRPLFGFQEPGYDPTAIREARITEVATVALLTTFLVARAAARRRRTVEPAAEASGARGGVEHDMARR